MIDRRLYQSTAVTDRFDEEAAGTAWCGVTVMRDGNAVLLSDQPALDWAADCMMFACDMARALNKHLHHDGFWYVGWTHPSSVFLLGSTGRTYQRAVMIWFDSDGDPAFTVEILDPIWDILNAGPDAWLEQCEIAWQRRKHLMIEVLDPKEGQTFKQAQGEAAPSARP